MKEKKNYTEEFKREAVARCKVVGPTKTSKELGVALSALHGWRKKYSDEPSNSTNKPSYAELEKQNRRLRKEIGYIEEINKVLKKSTAIFSSDQIKNTK